MDHCDSLNPWKGNRAERVAELIDQYGQMIYATAYRILGNADDAQDALQEVFLKVLGTWNGRLNPAAVRDWGAYLRVAASRSAVDLLRRNRSWRQSIGECIEKMETPAHQNPRHVAIQHQRATLLRKALRSLPKREARVFALRYFEDLSYEQIAEHMSLSINLIGVILHRARERLRKILEPMVSPSAEQTHTRQNPDAPRKENSHVKE